MNRRARVKIDWLPFLLWSILVNAVNIWIISPLVEDYFALGILAVFVLAAVWFISIPPKWRKKWVTFTVFSYLLGTAINSVTFFPLVQRVGLMFIMSVAMIVVVYFYAKLRVLPLMLSSVAIIGCNLWLPFQDWTFLTHFKIVYHGKAGLNPMDFPSLPMVIVPTQGGHKVLVTLSSLKETKQDVQTAVAAAGSSSNDLHNVIQSFNHRYQIVEVSENNGKFTMGPAKPNDIARLDPSQLFSSYFPMSTVYWTSQNGTLIQYAAPSGSPYQLMQLANDPAQYPSNVLAMSEQVSQDNQNNWDKLLNSLGVKPHQGLTISNGRLTGTWNGHAIDVPVDAMEVLATGSFTGPNSDEILLEGTNRLEIVNLNTGHLVTSYVGSAQNPLSSDVRVGPIDDSGQDMIFVNGSPAFILKASASGPWQEIYTAPPKSSLRFEGSAVFGSDKTPEILTDDPSLMRPTPTRLFTSYTYRNGQLYRNWRVYQSNVVNVSPVKFSANGPTYVVLSMFNQGQFFVLSRHFIPVVPITSALLGLSVLLGFILRLRKGEKRNATIPA